MRVSYEQLRANYRECVEGSAPKPLAFAQRVAEQVGLVDRRGVTIQRSDGTPCLAKDRKRQVADFNLRELTEAVLGERWQDVLGLGQGGSGFEFRKRFREEAAAPVGPSHLANVNAWTASVGALVDARMLEGYETSEFDFADFFPIFPVKYWNPGAGGVRRPVIIGPAEMAPPVGPGESHPDVRVDAMWVEMQGPTKYGNKALVTKESAFVDITGGAILDRALDIGFNIKFREHDLSLNAIVGLTNNFKLGLTSDASATGYNTYGATVPTGNGATGTLNNDLVNPMGDLTTTFQTSDQELTKYLHPVTGLPMPMATALNTVLLPSTLQWYGRFLLGIENMTIGTTAGSPVPPIAGTTFPTGYVTGKNPWAGRFSDVRISQWLYTKHNAATTSARPTIPVGLGLSAANSNRWYRLDPKKFACRLSAWEMQSIDLNPNDFVMADQGIVAGRVANIATAVQILNPWACQRNKVA